MKWLKSFGYALRGIMYSFGTEPNFRIHCCAAFMVLVFSVVFNISVAEWIAVCFCICFIMTMEMLNTAIERLCDIVHKEFHPGIKKVKDIAAGAVLVSAFFSVITGAIIFLPKIIYLIKSF